MITTNADNDSAANHLLGGAFSEDGFFSHVLAPTVGEVFPRLWTGNGYACVNGDKKRLVLIHNR
jgi:hypothetical protein